LWVEAARVRKVRGDAGLAFFDIEGDRASMLQPNRV
jgi:hypothetical protein